jgi:hypothetical protein
MSPLFRIKFYLSISFVISSLFWIFTVGYALLQQAYFLGTILTVSGITLCFGELQKHKLQIERTEQVEARISPAALAEEAYQFLPAYQRQVREGQRLIRNLRAPLQAGYDRLSKAISFVMFVIYVLMGALGIVVFANTELWLAVWVCFSPPLLIGLWVMIGAIFLRVEMSPEKIALITLWQRQELRWDEMEQIKVEGQGRKLLFCGANRCLAIRHLQALSYKPKEQMLLMLTAQIEHHHIKVEADELK